MTGRKRMFKLLCRNYLRIRISCDEELLDRLQRENDYYESFEWFERMMEGKDPDSVIESLRKTSDRTERLICSIDHALDEYGAIARREDMESFRQYDILFSRYFSAGGPKIRELARKYGVKKTKIYKDLKAAEIRMESILFGDYSPSGESL